MATKIKILYGVFFSLIIILIGLVYFVFLQPTQILTLENKVLSNDSRPPGLAEVKEIPGSPPVPHLKTPKSVKAVYMTNCVAITPSLRDRLLKLIDETEINSVVLDLKDYTGAISFTPTNKKLIDYAVSVCPIKDLKGLVKDLHDRDIYVIGRITVFQDPLFTKNNPEVAVKRESNPDILWTDRKGLTYTDPGSTKAHDHIIDISIDAYEQGVDELNFDYIRFPSDGNMSDIMFPISGGTKPQPEVLEKFFAYLDKELEDTGAVLSADVFGVTTNSFVDVGIGQVWERFLPYFDYIAPMVYPSHYYAGFEGYANTNLHPYEVVKGSLDVAVQRTLATTTVVKTLAGRPIASTTPQLYTKEAFAKTKVRPWLQDFDYPVPYTPAMVSAQIKATYDAGLDSWMMWDPTNTYTRSVYKTE